MDIIYTIYTVNIFRDEGIITAYNEQIIVWWAKNDSTCVMVTLWCWNSCCRDVGRSLGLLALADIRCPNNGCHPLCVLPLWCSPCSHCKVTPVRRMPTQSLTRQPENVVSVLDETCHLWQDTLSPSQSTSLEN